MEPGNPEIGAAPMVMSFGATSKLQFMYRCCASLMGLASIVAALPAAVLSFGCYGVAALLGRIRPVRDTCEFLSHAYDRALERLGQKVLRDPRDTAALRVMVSLTLSAVPIFAAQLVIGRLQLPLLIAFYLSLYGLKFQRFVRMFSASHLEAHRSRSYFSDKYDAVFGRYFEFFLGYLYGNIPELGRTAHVCLHHRENSGPEDTRNTLGYDRTSRLDFFWYLSDNMWTVLGIAPYTYFRDRGSVKNRKRMFWGMARYYAYFTAVFVYDWRIGLTYVLVPLLSMNLINAITAWVQHAFCDPDRPGDYFANSVTVVDEVNFMNEGYHLCHHHRAGLHWTEMPAHFERLRDKMKEAGSLVFRDMDFFGLFCNLTLFRRMDVLAQKLVPWEPMNQEQRVGLLARRTGLRSPS